ncbi:Tetratricopeptide repeat (TPR)-like superfamily protein [Striga hermonthica]|uniref:Tetratricopeptide repeat (TPR)-like superfamily protein n=1 Tax=Striga hermonthica TaxID=68872 RepID=A0A9N7NFU8_STRHE|nr:Tetratricopeptide repeat (TPR)-like superfamily protein [Striga hermonthica]
MQIALSRHEEAFNTLKGIVQQTEKESEDRAMVFAAMAKALCNQENFPDAKKCLDISCAIYEKEIKSSPDVVAEAFTEISTLYKTMNEFETAIASLLRKTLAMLEKLRQEQHSVGSVLARIGWLLLLTGKVEQAVSVLEDAAERLKESFGLNHYGVGYVYNNLGAAYLEPDRPQSATQVFAYAKEIMDVALGPHHVDSIEACQNLSKAYAAIGSNGPSTQEELVEVVRLPEHLKEREARMKAFTAPEKDMNLPFLAKYSPSGKTAVER